MTSEFCVDVINTAKKALEQTQTMEKLLNDEWISYESNNFWRNKFHYHHHT